MRIEQKLLRMAARQDACRAGLDKLAGMTDRNDMVNLYLENIDFCLSKDFPENAIIGYNASFGKSFGKFTNALLIAMLK